MEASVFSVIFVSLFLLVTSQNTSTDSCSSNLAVSNLIPFDTSSFHCLSAWSSQSFTLRYAKSDNSTWSFVVSAPNTNAYIAIGFSSDGKMVGSSAIVGWVNSSGTGTVKQYYLGAEDSSSCPPDQGKLTVVNNSTTIISQSSVLYMSFEITAEQTTPYLIYSVGPRGTLPSSNYYLTEHRDMASASFNAQTGVIGQASTSSGFSKARTHALLVILGWGALIPIGAIVARYFKHHDPHWFYGHISIQAVGFVLGLAGIIVGFGLDDSGVNDIDTHKAIGITVLVLGCLQVMAFLARPDKSSKIRKYWNWYHHNIGRLAIAFGIANIFFGLHIAEESNSWFIGYGVFIGIWVLATVGFEIRFWATRDD